MTFKTIFAAPVFGSSAQEQVPARALARYAIELAASQQAHLSLGVAVIRISAPAAIIMREARSLIANANADRKQHAEAFAAEACAQAQGAGVPTSVEIAADDYNVVAEQLVRMARHADVAVMQADDESVSLQEGLLKELLFDSSRPVIVVPRNWANPAAPEKIIVAWDGSAKAARALGDAMPLLRFAKQVEVVSISGDPDPAKRMEAADIAAHLSRHCPQVTMTNLPAQDGDVAATLGNHARLTRANLIVMGAFARPKFRQFVLGGVTSSMISNPPVPVMLSY